MYESLSKALEILSTLSANAENSMTLTELSSRTGLNISTCSHIVSTLVDNMYVEKVSRSKGYRLGPGAFMLSRYGRYEDTLVNQASPVLKWLHKKTGATVMLAVVRNGKKYIIYHIDEAGLLPMSDGSIIQGSLEKTVSGLLLMAYMDTEELVFNWNKRLSDTRLPVPNYSARDLRKIFEDIKTRGYLHRSIPENDTEAFAFGVFKNNSIVASVGILCENKHDIPDLIDKMIYYGFISAKEITRRLNNHNPSSL